MNRYELAYKIVFAIHALVWTLMMAGPVASVWVKKARIPTVAFWATVFVCWFTFKACPLTKMENTLRQSSGTELIGDEGFIVYYFNKIFGIILPPDVINTASFIIGAFMLMLSLIYLSMYLAKRYRINKVAKQRPKKKFDRSTCANDF